MATYLGLDLGTSGLKGVLIGEDQAVVATATATAPLDVSRPHPGWSEQDPDDWIRAAETVLADLAAQARLGEVAGIGLSGQMHGATCLGADDRPLRPCILWNDTRAATEAAAMDADPMFREVTGNIVFPGFTAPKLAWLAAHEPGIFAAVQMVLLPKDYLRLWLTGVHASDMSDAAGTAWLDTGARAWSAKLLARTGLGPDRMPALVEGSQSSGPVRPEVAARYGLAPGVPVAGGGGDNAAAAVGLGVVAPDRAFVSLGTSGVLFAATENYAPAPEAAVHAFCHALPGAWHQMGVILAATDALNWFARLTGRTPAELVAALPAGGGPGRTLFLPYLGGERTPLNDAAIRGAFVGLDHATDIAAATRAVIEGVTFALLDCRDALAATGTRVDRLIATGGGARSEAWLAMIATAFGVPVDRPASAEAGAALGAARLGMMAATGGGAELAPLPEIERSFEPDPRQGAAFAESHARYRAARDAIRGLT